MNRLKLLGAVALLGVLACEEATPPPPVGSIVGQVAIEGTGIDGVSVNLSNGSSTTTAGGGSYRFDNVEGGAYTVTISGYPSDATFDATSAAATISTAGQSVTLNFSGSYIRTASVMGTVTADDQGIGGVTVALSGVSPATTTTDDNGQYAFTGLRSGSYSVEISGFDSDEIGFSSTTSAVAVGVGESKIVSFPGTYLRTAGIQGQVSVEGEGLAGVTVSLSGGPEGVDETATTDAAGQYSFARLRAGDYAVGISGYDTDDYEFEVTSQNVTVALGETATVPFDGVLLRTSGISGRVSVEGDGLEGVTVTLSMADADDQTATTDAGGLYAFAGLAAGTYTVAISDFDEAAYIFEATSKEVTVADDETAIENFEGDHARTASVSGMLFVDEAAKNDTYDEGEDFFAMAGVPMALVGPGINEQRVGASDADGAFAFDGLRSGTYQLVVDPLGEADLGDYAYGGPGTGYSFELGVGESETQHVPIDITHQTVDFSVTLRSGEATGDALPGAVVTLYADLDGRDLVAEGETGEDGMAAVRFARSAASGSTVYAMVAAPEAYSGSDEMQAVQWDAKNRTVSASNDGDIVNLAVSATFGGATVATAYGGGEPLAGWAVEVTTGEGDDAEAVEGAPEALGDEGTATLEAEVAHEDLPVAYTLAIAENQANSLDGGETYAADPIEYTHTGLSLADTHDAGTIEVRYTTQTLRVYVHHERDQVYGYTGNILDGDMRMSGKLDVNVKHINANGRAVSFPPTQWRKSNATYSDNARGVLTFSGVPAAAKVVVQASKAADAGNIVVLTPDELSAYDNREENGAKGGAFGDEGGFHHTVELCPLMSRPEDQDHGACGSFAFVNTHLVDGQHWKNRVRTDDADGFRRDTTLVPGTSLAMAPVAGKNLAGADDSFAAATSNDRNTPWDDRAAFNFGQMAAGVYSVSVTEGWVADSGREVNLASDLNIDVTPGWGIAYGRVTDNAGFALEGVTVTVNGVEAVTDEHGRYIAEGYSAQTRRVSNAWQRNRVFVTAAAAGQDAYDNARNEGGAPAFAPNAPLRHDFKLNASPLTATISGTVRHSGSNEPISRVEIKVDGKAPRNAEQRSWHPDFGKLLTGEDGSYTAIVDAVELGVTVPVTASKEGLNFVPAAIPVPADVGREVSGIDFTAFTNATITGRVVEKATGGPLEGVKVTATNGSQVVEYTTGVTGTYTLSVSYGTFTITASKESYTFTYKDDVKTISVGPAESRRFGDITGASGRASGISATRVVETSTGGLKRYTDSTVVTWSTDEVEGYSYTVQYNGTRDGSWGSVAGDGSSPDTLKTSPDTAFMVRVRGVRAADADAGITADTLYSATATVAAVDPSAGDVEAGRSETNADTIMVSWDATTNGDSKFRIVAQLSDGIWYVADPDPTGGSNARAWTFDAGGDGQVSWTSVDGSSTKNTVKAELAKAFSIAVESVQGTQNDETNPWKRSAVVDVTAKPSS